MTYGNFNGKNRDTPLNSAAILNILTQMSDINAEWLLTGQGEMMKKNDAGETETKENALHLENDNKELWGLIKSQQRMLEQNSNVITLLTQQLAQKGAAADVRGVALAAEQG